MFVVHFVDKSVRESAYKKSTRLKSVKVEVEKKKASTRGRKPEKKIVFGRIQGRSSPRWLTAILKASTVKQHNLIRELGFGSLLEGWFDFETVPTKLGLFVVQMFDPKTCRLIFPDGRTIKVTKELIHEIVGFPVNEIAINLESPCEGGEEIVQEFRKYFEVSDKERFIVNRIHDWMIDYIEGDRWYKLCFLALVTTLLIECPKNGAVNEKILAIVDSNSVDIHDLDWCGLILDAIVRTTTEFKPNNNFNGPLLILMLIYVNSTTIGDEEVLRMKPGIRNWNSETLTARENEEMENGGFALENVNILAGYEEISEESSEEQIDSPLKKRKKSDEMGNF